MAGLFKVPAPVAEMKRHLKRALSPQPSTSSAPEALPKEYARRQILHSAYEHLHESVRLTDIGQLRGLKTGRRRGRWRRTHMDRLLLVDPDAIYATQSKIFDNLMNDGSNFDLGLAEKFGDAVKLMQPLIMDELLTQHTLVASALEHFATVVNQIVDDAEKHQASSTESLGKRTTIKRMFQDCDEDEPVLDKEEADGQSSKEEEEEEEEDENTKAERIRLETAAAVFALLKGRDSTKAYDSDSAENSRFSENPGAGLPEDALKDDSFTREYE